MVCGGGLDAQLDFQQVLSTAGANHRSRLSEKIYKILKNYKDYRMAQEPEQMPRSGSVYLFNKKKTKHFRKDGHNWKKRKGGKRDMEWHENLKVEDEHKLLCYYAVGEENKNFKRRIYSLREKDLSHIVLVHYLEVKDQESGDGSKKNFDVGSSSNRPGLACNCSTKALNMRFEELLSSGSTSPNCDPTSMAEDSELSGKSSSLQNNNKDMDEILQSLLNWGRGKGQLLQQLTEKFCAWIWQKLAGGGKGLSVLDEGGQGVLHFGAALGYDWVLLPTIMAGVSVDFRDVNGWTALHWAAHFGRDETVKSLIELGVQLIDLDPIELRGVQLIDLDPIETKKLIDSVAELRALTDPIAIYPPGATPADLALQNGHFKTADYLTYRLWL